ncbi:MAG: hypothetical protein UV38_C0005G0012 [candidate division TM6 bacterium GW2011_GWE2_42_60]|nr:MAG: hypothetical protein UV38_C0005G0012 [candidate division TM6 bacterium GW2011_GWE2_42_60]
MENLQQLTIGYFYIPCKDETFVNVFSVSDFEQEMRVLFSIRE